MPSNHTSIILFIRALIEYLQQKEGTKPYYIIIPGKTLSKLDKIAIARTYFKKKGETNNIDKKIETLVKHNFTKYLDRAVESGIIQKDIYLEKVPKKSAHDKRKYKKVSVYIIPNILKTENRGYPSATVIINPFVDIFGIVTKYAGKLVREINIHFLQLKAKGYSAQAERLLGDKDQREFKRGLFTLQILRNKDELTFTFLATLSRKIGKVILSPEDALNLYHTLEQLIQEIHRDVYSFLKRDLNLEEPWRIVNIHFSIVLNIHKNTFKKLKIDKYLFSLLKGKTDIDFTDYGFNITIDFSEEYLEMEVKGINLNAIGGAFIILSAMSSAIEKAILDLVEETSS